MFERKSLHQSLRHSFPADERATDALEESKTRERPKPYRDIRNHKSPSFDLIAPARSCLPTWPRDLPKWILYGYSFRSSLFLNVNFDHVDQMYLVS